jgi:endonuclease IV
MNEVVKQVKLRIKGKTEVVGSCTVPIYDSVEELIEKESIENILAQFNKGNTITLMGIERNKHKPQTAGKQKRMMIGLSLITTEEFQNLAGDPDAIKEFVESPEVQARIDAKLDADNPSSGDADEE